MNQTVDRLGELVSKLEIMANEGKAYLVDMHNINSLYQRLRHEPDEPANKDAALRYARNLPNIVYTGKLYQRNQESRELLIAISEILKQIGGN